MFKMTASCLWTVSVKSFDEFYERSFGVDWKEVRASFISVGTTTCISACPIPAPRHEPGRPNWAYMLKNLHLPTPKMRISPDLSRYRTSPVPVLQVSGYGCRFKRSMQHHLA